MLTAYMGGGAYSHFGTNGCPIVEADNTWRDRLAAKAFILGLAIQAAEHLGAAWVQVRDDTRRNITAKIRPATAGAEPASRRGE